MGSFSWLKADKLTKVANIAQNKPFKFLIPKEFGGGFIKDNYQNYGHLGTKENGEPKYDMYELLAFWNKDKLEEGQILFFEGMCFNGNFPLLKEIDEYTVHNRSLGINIGCYDYQINKLKYPLKLVSVGFKGTYEDLSTPSYGDPLQGFGVLPRGKNLDGKLY